ncbi:hypothetical protein M378DRAFT_22884 [Amanita muscaria Koide BX008]|uniref:Uncharacterized protein n=1 Tax=Amanita muscaria (strain Koide BX008) TaxID=946122 RepID=A0A0C2TJT9_AMAMK|nr:hypothetical protein M378DRAFT_22884 [Amanita muscaria Koide BX008]
MWQLRGLFNGANAVKTHQHPRLTGTRPTYIYPAFPRSLLTSRDYLPTPPPADTATDDGMDVDEVPIEVDDVEVRPKQRVIRVTVDVVTSRWRLTLFPPNVGRFFRVLPGMSMWLTTLPLNFDLSGIDRRWDTSCSEKSSKTKSTKDDSATAIATSSKVKLENMPLLFASVETSSNSFNGVHHVKCKEPEARCIRKTRFSSPPRLVKQSKIDDNLFLTSNRQSPKSGRTPGRNIHNESVFKGCSDADYPRLAVAYSPIQDADTLFPETKRFSPTPDLAVNNRWLKISRTPDHIIYNEPTTAEDNNTDYSSLCMGYPPSEDTENSLLEIDFAEADPSLNWASVTLTPETPHRIPRTKLFIPLGPVKQSKLDKGYPFITSKRQTPDLINNKLG